MHLKQPFRRFTGVRANTVPTVDGNLKNGRRVVLPATKEYADEAIQSINAGKVIAVPTDTLYGFACDAWYALQLCFLFISFLQLW